MQVLSYSAVKIMPLGAAELSHKKAPRLKFSAITYFLHECRQYDRKQKHGGYEI